MNCLDIEKEIARILLKATARYHALQWCHPISYVERGMKGVSMLLSQERALQYGRHCLFGHNVGRSNVVRHFWNLRVDAKKTHAALTQRQYPGI